MLKKIVSVFLSVVFVLATAVIVSASSTSNVSDELTNLKRYYATVNKLTDWNEVLLFASQGMLTSDIEISEPEYEENNAVSCSQLILISIARGFYPDTYLENLNLTTALAEMQNDSGLFGNVQAQYMAILALDAAKTSYQKEAAVKELIAFQREDGSFSENDAIQNTSLAVSALCFYQKDPEVKSAIDRAISFLKNAKAKNSIEISWKITALVDAGADPNTGICAELVAELLTYKNQADNSYSATHQTLNAEPEATAMAMIALDAINRSSSVYQRIAAKGYLQQYSLSDFKPLIYTYLVLFIFAIVFWIYVFLKKKNIRTLEEAKAESEQKLYKTAT